MDKQTEIIKIENQIKDWKLELAKYPKSITAIKAIKRLNEKLEIIKNS